MTDEERQAIEDIVRGLDPIDWVQMRLTASLSPADRFMAGVRAAEFARAMVRGTLTKRFPKLSRSELNMKVLAYFTPICMETP